MMNDKKKTIQIGGLSTGNGEGSIGLLRKILELTKKIKTLVYLMFFVIGN